MFKAGQKVRCITDCTSGMYNEIPPIRGKIYTVRDVVFNPISRKDSIRLVEIQNQVRNYGACGIRECTWSTTYFQLISEEPFVKSVIQMINDHITANSK